MSLSVCTSCLARLRLSNPPIPSLTAASRLTSSPFHSSAPAQNVIKKKTANVAGTRAPKLRESRSARIKKKQKERPRPPPVGQRRSERRRIVLSNTNALQIQGLETLTPENMADAAKVGSVLALDGPVIDQLREAKAFKTTQNWNLFRAPSTLVRMETVEVGADIQDVNESVSDTAGLGASTLRRVVTGEKASGKSIHLLQAMSLAYLNKWVVVNVPDCQEYVNNQSAYTPVARKEGDESKEQMYNQPQLAADLLTRLAYSNSDVLSKLKPIHKHGERLDARKPKTLKDLALIGAEDRNLAPRVWDAIWKELTVPVEGNKEKRPPVLVAIDGVNFWMGDTKYRSNDFKVIHAHQFTLVKQFLSLLFSKDQKNALANGGMAMGVTTKSNHPATPAFELLVRQLRARNNGVEMTDSAFPLGDPYAKMPDARVTGLFHPDTQTTVTELKGLSRPESKGLLEYFAKSGIFRDAVTDSAVAEKWSLSGGGIVGEMCKLGARTRVGMFETGPREGVKVRV
ncbi:hypothetical protein PMZ80_004069 [Knufia obscura]|uniref:Small ribosomal subunit protein mS29 n=1 Tax=Knufia obscura TaxID=1635080 RepID=A0ABR0RR06_9EURO|nr:hypothetical protein PMZ80_004069 [Knufia obscura]